MTSLVLASDALSSSDMQKVQRLRKWALLGLFVFGTVPFLFTDSHWYKSGSLLYGLIEEAGLLLIFACILGRTWCSLYIGGRKKRELVTVGPYSLVRNPLYVFTLIGAFGIGAQSGCLTVACWFAGLAFAVFSGVVRAEEQFLADQFPLEFPAYARRVPRYLPRFSGWRDVELLEFRPKLMRRTFLDASLFLLAVPAADLLETLQRNGIVPVLFYLP